MLEEVLTALMISQGNIPIIKPRLKKLAIIAAITLIIILIYTSLAAAPPNSRWR